MIRITSLLGVDQINITKYWLTICSVEAWKAGRSGISGKKLKCPCQYIGWMSSHRGTNSCTWLIMHCLNALISSHLLKHGSDMILTRVHYEFQLVTQAFQKPKGSLGIMCRSGFSVRMSEKKANGIYIHFEQI